MRFSRNDIVKNFEEITKQEIRNHNEQMAQTNQAINELRESMTRFSKLVSESFALQETRNQNIAWGFAELVNTMEEKYHEIEKIANDSKRLCETVKSGHDHLDSKIEGVFSKAKKNAEPVEYLSQSLSNLDSHVKQLDMKLGQELKYMADKVKFTVDDLKRKSDEIPAYFRKHESEIADCLDTQRVDINCLRTDLEHFKKSVLYIEKKIENIYTLIDRLNKKVSN